MVRKILFVATLLFSPFLIPGGVKALTVDDVETVFYDGGEVVFVHMNVTLANGTLIGAAFEDEDDKTGELIYAETFSIRESEGGGGVGGSVNISARLLAEFQGLADAGDFVFYLFECVTQPCLDKFPDGLTEDRAPVIGRLFRQTFTGGEAECEGSSCIEVRDYFFGEDIAFTVRNPFDNNKCEDDYSVRLVVNGALQDIYVPDVENSATAICKATFDEGSDLVEELKNLAGAEESKSILVEIIPKVEIRPANELDLGNKSFCYYLDGGAVGAECGEDAPGEVVDPVEETCSNLPTAAERDSCYDCFAKNDGDQVLSAFVWSEIGCIDTSQDGAATRITQIGFGIYGGIALIRLGIAAFKILSGDTAKIQEGREEANAALWSLVALAGAIPILQFLGLNVLGILPEGFFT